MPSKKSKPTKSVKVVSAVPADKTLTTSPMPFDPTPWTQYNSQAVRPLTCPASRQLQADKNVIVHNKKAGL